MPVLTIEGDKAMGGALEIQAKLVANNVTFNKVKRYGPLADGTALAGNESRAQEVFRQVRRSKERGQTVAAGQICVESRLLQN